MFEFSLILTRVAWTATYTYILLLFVSAVFVAYLGRPKDRKKAFKQLYAGTLINPEDAESAVSKPHIRVRCMDNNMVVIERLGVEGLTSSGAVSLATTFKGNDVEIIERVTPGYPNDTLMAGASFTIDMSGAEWRHIKWNNEENGLWCAFSLHVRNGICFNVDLKR